MSSAVCISVILGFLCILNTVVCQTPIQCYECGNLLDPKCGTTFDMDPNSEAARKYLKECDKEAVACQKLQYEDDMHGANTGGVVVTRSCWVPPEGDTFEPKECQEMYSGKACYCLESKCNGGRLVKSSVFTFLALLAPFVYKIVFS